VTNYTFKKILNRQRYQKTHTEYCSLLFILLFIFYIYFLKLQTTGSCAELRLETLQCRRCRQNMVLAHNIEKTDQACSQQHVRMVEQGRGQQEPRASWPSTPGGEILGAFLRCRSSRETTEENTEHCQDFGRT
jgi:hypothetical protein